MVSPYWVVRTCSLNRKVCVLSVENFMTIVSSVWLWIIIIGQVVFGVFCVTIAILVSLGVLAMTIDECKVSYATYKTNLRKIRSGAKMFLNLKSPEKRHEEKKARLKNWHRRFVIYARMSDDQAVFMQWVEGKATYHSWFDEKYWSWEYRIADPE